MMKRSELTDFLDFATRLAQEAGVIAQRYFSARPPADIKADGSFVTAADQEVEKFLRTAIAKSFPDDAILGEEDGEQSGTTTRRWIIDPIDGTFSFVHGVPLYGVMIGLEVDDEPVAGVVNLPSLGELICAASSVGCFFNGEPAHVSATRDLGEALLLSGDFGEGQGLGRTARSLQGQVKARRDWGDCYGHILVATGRAEIMLDPVVSVWDCAPLLPIMEEAGGTFTDWNGARTIRGGSAISTNGLLFDEVMKILREGAC
jgi:histidinol phosphatase-like enzyme (inositol monophosphatase family)